MNKHCWRIIFNPARNMLMVVADIARAPHGGPGRGSVASRRCLPRLKGLCFSLWLALGAVYPACAEVVADRTAPGRQQPTVISSADGTPQVNIQTPGRGGVSRNVYSRFDVDKKGLILNNSHAHTATQLGGMVSANPWLAKGEARVILNEVNARDPSRLNGFIEVAGRQAQVVIASPAGITCDGCGFINTSRATLTTGQVLLNDSGIAGYRTGAGTVAVTGAGMDSTQANHTDIIARAVQVNAGIWARELRITGGASETDAAHDTVSPGTQAAAGRPDFGVDVSQLGGMYAGKIRLSGTERGVGVRNAGHIGAQAGTVVVGVDGRIDNSGQIVAQGGMDLAARGTLDNSGAVHGGGSVTVTAVGALHNSGFLASAQHTTLRADSVTVTGEGTLAAGLGSDGRFADTGDLTVTSQGALIAGGQSRAAGEIQLTGSGIDIRGSRSHGRDIILNARGGEVVTAQAAVSAQQRLTIREAAVLDNRGGSLSGDQLQVDAGRLVNGQGQMVQRGGQDQTFTLRDGLDNRGGVISSNARQWRIDTTQLDNTGGQLLHDGGQFTLAATRLWDDGGDIVSRGGLSLSAGQLQMNDSRTQAQALSVTGDSLAHRNGRMFQSGSGMMSLTLTGALDNQGGQIVASQGDLTFRGVQVDNRQGWLAAGGAFLATSSALDNSGGLLQAGAGLTLDTRGRQLINRHSGEQGGIISGGGLTLRSGELDNAQGVIAGGQDVRLTTLAFSNQQGALRAGADLSVATQQQALDNRRGTLQGAGKIRLDTGQLDNRDGSVTGGALDIDAGSALLSQGGELLSPGDIRISAAQTDNTGGLIRSGKTLAVTTDALLNGDTHRAGKGMEGDRVSVTAQRLDNRQGAIRAGQQLALAVSSTLDNTRGLLSAEQQLAVDGGSTLAFTASGGTVVADRESRIAARAMSGDGDILSGGALALSLSETFSHQGRIVAGGDADIRIQGGVNNRGQILAGGALTLNAAELTNQAGGEISATENHLLIGGTLLNDGLLDGGLTHIVSGTLINGPGGRLYGDHIAIATGLLENAGNGESAPVIAARERLDIGAQRLNNRRHGLIYSTGGLAIGGALDAGYHASGRAQSVDNHSARIEAGDSLWLNTATLNNINDRFATTTATTSVSQHHEMTFQGATERYDWADVDLSERDKYGVRRARTADGKSGQEFYEYNYTRTVRETQVTDSDPGQIIAGGGMTVDADRATNRDSQVVSGGTLITRVGVLDNQGTTGERITTEEGRQTRWYPKKTKRTIGGTKTSQGRRSSDWRPAPRTQTIDLGVQAWQGNARITGSGTVIAGRSAAQPGSQSEARGAGMAAAVTVVPLRVAGGQAADREVRVMMPDFRLPDSRLFTLSPDSTAGYLTQTDPRFTRARQWLGSDYMMNQLTGSPDGLLKRLGDGYYEQKLVRDQIMNLTGQRFLDGFSSDEAQYRQLMDNGVTLARQYNLSPGVALTAEQMALLTADMVWLVRQTVTLPDGSTRDVLAPQVYARVRPGDVDGGGALLAGRSIAMNLTGALNNSGVIAGRERVQISAQEVTNRGRMDAGRLELSARQDITNTGGVLTGRDGVSLLAGRDILSRSTLSANADGEYADRLAGIFVQNAGGKMTLAALNDIRLDASQLSGQGDVLLQAGHDLTLGTLTQTHSEHSRFGKNNWRTLTRYQDSGSTLSAAGDLTLLAGNHLTATAATLSADKALTLQSGGDMAISAGRGGYHLTEHSRQASKGLLSGRSSERHDEVIINRAHGASLGGDSITLISGRDLTISGSSVAGTRDVALQAGRNLTVTTAAESVDEIHWRKEQKTGLSGTGGIGFSYGSQQIRVTDSADTLGGRGSIVGSSQGRLTLSAGNRLDVQGSELIAGRDMALVGREVAITDARESSVQRHQVEQKSSGFTLALSGAAGSALNTAVQTAQSAREENDSRLSALTATKAALSGVQAAQALRLDNAQGEAGGGNNTVGISLSYGSQSSTSTQTQTRSQAQGSALIAGNNLSITATGGDVTVQGSQLQAGRDMLLSAERDVNLLSAQNTQRLEGKNDSRGGSVGVGIGVGSGGWGISVSASMNQGKGSERGNGTTHSETMLNAGRQVTIISGRDTTLSGAQVSGETVKARVGRNLTLASQQDSSRYDMKQQNASAGGSFTFGSMSGSGSV
uniref:hemagglutinin repeat-containing protein n=1 Tax=Entomohabitans teleogrylli TaxID=1384589 RepID=UPI00073D904F